MKKMMIMALVALSFASTVGHAATGDDATNLANECKQLKIHILRADSKLKSLKADAEENESRSLQTKIDIAELDYNVSKKQYKMACK
jgi:hypothetical protein